MNYHVVEAALAKGEVLVQMDVVDIAVVASLGQ